MSKGRISMRKIREILKLIYGNGLSRNKAAAVCNVGRATSQTYLRRFEASGLAWPLSPEITDEELENKLYPVKIIKSSENSYPIDFEYHVVSYVNYLNHLFVFLFKKSYPP